MPVHPAQQRISGGELQQPRRRGPPLQRPLQQHPQLEAGFPCVVADPDLKQTVHLPWPCAAPPRRGGPCFPEFFSLSVYREYDTTFLLPFQTKFDSRAVKYDIPSPKFSPGPPSVTGAVASHPPPLLCWEQKGRITMLSVQDLHKSYQVGKTTYEVLKGVSLEVAKGEFVAVMGPSGSGKTTLLNCISCYIPADSGSIRLGSQELARLDEDTLAAVRNKKLGFVFQDFLLLDGLTVRDNILLPRIIAGETGGDMEQAADRLCGIFGIGAIRNKYPAEISGGEKQRTAVARALINHPMLLLADEPTGNLDSRSSRAVIDAFLQAKADLEATIFMVTHDSFAASFCDRVIILRDGGVWRTLARGEKDRRTFQDELLDAVREMGEASAQ